MIHIKSDKKNMRQMISRFTLTLIAIRVNKKQEQMEVR